MNRNLFNVKTVGNALNTGFKNMVSKAHNPFKPQTTLSTCIGINKINFKR